MKPTNTELDTLIAEKVMNFKKAYTPTGYNQQWVMPSRNESSEHRKHFPNRYGGFSPSTKIEDAWMVVDKMISTGFEISDAGYSRQTKKWDFTFGNGCSFSGPLCDTVTRAICLSALAAIGVEVA